MNHDDSVSGLRKCRKCGLEKEGSAFRPDKKAANGRHYPRKQCRKCENEAWRNDWLVGKKGRQKAAVLTVNVPPVVVPQKGQSIRAQLEESVLHRMACYQCDALDALHDLAMMPISETNSMLNQIKLAAARLLAGPSLSPEATGGAPELDKVLRDLDERYRASAPRIKAIRERIVNFGHEERAPRNRPTTGITQSDDNLSMDIPLEDIPLTRSKAMFPRAESAARVDNTLRG